MDQNIVSNATTARTDFTDAENLSQMQFRVNIIEISGHMYVHLFGPVYVCARARKFLAFRQEHFSQLTFNYIVKIAHLKGTWDNVLCRRS